MEKYTLTSTVMLVDIVGPKTSPWLKEIEAKQIHANYDWVAIPVFTNFGGAVIRRFHDAFLVNFKSARDAVWCAIELQKLFLTKSKEKKLETPMRIKAVMHYGQVINKDDDVSGEPVHIVEKLLDFAKDGQIIFTQEAFIAMKKKDIPFVYMGSKKVPGVKEPMKLFRVKSKVDFMKEKKRFNKGNIIKMLEVLFWFLFSTAIAGIVCYSFFNYSDILRLLLL